jgi:phosphotransferase system HPr-like phosphotransfer protein
MITVRYRLKKDLLGRTANQFSWKLQDCPFQIHLTMGKDGRIINGKSLIGILSGRFRAGSEIEIATRTLESQEYVENVIKELELAEKLYSK